MRTFDEPVFCKIVRRVLHTLYPPITLEGMDNLPADGPCIIVGNHAQAHGPIVAEMRLPFPLATWCNAQMLVREEVADYAYADFWGQKPKSVRWIYWLASRIIPLPASFILSHVRTIPVYRDARGLTTFRTTVEKLNEGCSIIIFPECPTPHNHIVYQFQDKFPDVAKLYHRRTGKCLTFVPMYVCPDLKKTVFGKGIRYDPEMKMDVQREVLANYLMDEITRMAQALPRHRVVPYLNLPRKDRPYNIPQQEAEHETNTL